MLRNGVTGGSGRAGVLLGDGLGGSVGATGAQALGLFLLLLLLQLLLVLPVTLHFLQIALSLQPHPFKVVAQG